MYKASLSLLINHITVHHYLAVKILLLTIFKIEAKISGVLSGNKVPAEAGEDKVWSNTRRRTEENSSQLTRFDFLSCHVVHAA